MTDEHECPAGGEHVWTDAVGPEHEYYPKAWRWHCDECGVEHGGRDDLSEFDRIADEVQMRCQPFGADCKYLNGVLYLGPMHPMHAIQQVLDALSECGYSVVKTGEASA